MDACESWTIKKAEHWRIDAFELWCWRKCLRVPWTAQRSNQSILKEISPEYSLERLMLKLKLQYFGHLMWRTDSFEKTLMLGKIECKIEGDNRGWDDWIASLTQWTWVWASSGSWWWTGKPGMLQFMGSQRVGHDWVTELNWIELTQGVVEWNGPPERLELYGSTSWKRQILRKVEKDIVVGKVVVFAAWDIEIWKKIISVATLVLGQCKIVKKKEENSE